MPIITLGKTTLPNVCGLGEHFCKVLTPAIMPGFYALGAIYLPWNVMATYKNHSCAGPTTQPPQTFQISISRKLNPIFQNMPIPVSDSQSKFDAFCPTADPYVSVASRTQGSYFGLLLGVYLVYLIGGARESWQILALSDVHVDHVHNHDDAHFGEEHGRLRKVVKNFLPVLWYTMFVDHLMLHLCMRLVLLGLSMFVMFQTGSIGQMTLNAIAILYIEELDDRLKEVLFDTNKTLLQFYMEENPKEMGVPKEMGGSPPRQGMPRKPPCSVLYLFSSVYVCVPVCS